MTETIIRSSSLSRYSDCARRSASRLFRDEIEAAGFVLGSTQQGVGASVGTAVHAGVALTLQEKATSGSLAPIGTVTDCAIEAYRETVREGVLYDQGTPAGSVAEAQIVRMVTAYQRVIAPTVEPVLVESRLECDTGLGLIVSGQMDVVAQERGGRIRDAKTGRGRSSHKPQIGSYSLIARTHGYPIIEAAEDFIQRTPISKPQAEPVTYLHDVVDAEVAAISVLKHIAADIKVFREGDDERGILPGDPWAFISNPASMLCGAKYCPAYGSKGPHSFCKEWMEKDA